MKMCCNGVLEMPSSYVAMEEDEMMYVEGGFSYTYSKRNIRAKVYKKYLTRSVCLAFAEQVIWQHGNRITQMCNGMGIVRIAAELFSHAVGYYSASLLKKTGLNSMTINDIRNCGKYADIGLGDGLDLAYIVIWNCGLI